MSAERQTDHHAADTREPCKLGHRFACPHPTALPRPDQRCYCGAVTWAEANRSDAATTCECLDGGHNTGNGACMCGGVMRPFGCGHAPTQYVTADEGTSYCPLCETEARAK